MVITRKILIEEARILGVFILASVVQVFITCKSCTTVRSFALFTAFTVLLWIFLWRGNSFLADYLSAKISWIHEPVKRFTAGLLVTIGYTLLSVLLLITVFERFFGFNFGGGYRFTILASVLITVLISLFLHAREFLIFWRKAAFDSAKFQRESISARYETLKSRVNPAFLFHSLNTLSELVPRDEEKAVKYIKQLADVYRYMLDTREKEVVLLSEEMTFMSSYAALLKARYGIDLDIMVSSASNDRFILPLAAHMITECLLATGIAESAIRITEEPGYISIAFRIRSMEGRDDTFNDVMNKIRGRYSFVSDVPVAVHAAEAVLTVLLPVMTTLPGGSESSLPTQKIIRFDGSCD